MPILLLPIILPAGRAEALVRRNFHCRTVPEDLRDCSFHRGWLTRYHGPWGIRCVILLTGEAMNVPADWGNFFAAEVGASATLTGLVVVAISINLSRILAFAQLPGRAAEALCILGGVLTLTSLGLVPNQPVTWFGAEALAIGLVMLLAPLVIQWRSLKSLSDIPRAKRYVRIVMSLAAGLPVAAAGVTLLLGHEVGLYGIAAGVIFSLVTGVFNAWVLLVEILR